MPRKLQFYQKKGERRRLPRQLKVSIDINRIQLHYPISIPLDHVTLSNSLILSHLYNNILTTHSLPSNWQVSFHNDQLICQKELFVVIISSAMKWNFQYESYTVHNNSCFLLSGIPPVIYNLQALANLLNAIDGGQLCIGNADASYLNLAHKGKFVSHSGICI